LGGELFKPWNPLVHPHAVPEVPVPLKIQPELRTCAKGISQSKYRVRCAAAVKIILKLT